MKAEKKEKCRLCESTSLQMILDMGHSPIGEYFHFKDNLHLSQDIFPVQLVRCTTCANIQLGHVVDKEDIYVENYLYTMPHSPGLDKHFIYSAKKISQLQDVNSGDFIVDIGSNEGSFLQEMKQLGFQVHGLKLAISSAKISDNSNIPTICKLFDKETAKTILSEKGMAKIITSNNCFANIDNLEAVMQGVDLLLAPDGWFIIETGYALDLIQNFVIDNIYHEHLSYFLLNPLRSFFNKHGLEIAHVERVATKGGSIRVYARRAEQVKELPAQVKGLMTLEAELGFLSEIPFERFTAHANVMREKIHNEIDLLAKQGPCAAFGAAVGCTALIYWAQLGNFFDFIVDDNPIMHGRFSPGYHIPVYAPDHLYESNVKNLVLLPWRYLLPIKKRHQNFIDKGGVLINILPELVRYTS